MKKVRDLSVLDKTQVIPNQNMSPRSMFDRFKKGLPVQEQTQKGKEVYLGDVHLPNLKAMDITQIDELRASTNAKVETLKASKKEVEADLKAQNLQKIQKDKQDAKDKQAFEEWKKTNTT